MVMGGMEDKTPYDNDNKALPSRPLFIQPGLAPTHPFRLKAPLIEQFLSPEDEVPDPDKLWQVPCACHLGLAGTIWKGQLDEDRFEGHRLTRDGLRGGFSPLGRLTGRGRAFTGVGKPPPVLNMTGVELRVQTKGNLLADSGD